VQLCNYAGQYYKVLAHFSIVQKKTGYKAKLAAVYSGHIETGAFGHPELFICIKHHQLMAALPAFGGSDLNGGAKLEWIG
jgi:hypothetical protein